jgi:hypothetical protein
MSNEQYWEDDNDNLESESNRPHGSYGDDGIANLRKAKRADEKRIKELEEQLAKFSKESNERTVKEILESKGVNTKATRLVLKDLDTINEDAVSNWLIENGDLIGYTPNQEKPVDTENLRALQQQDSATQSADTPAYSEDLERAIANATSEEEIMSIIKNLG